MATQTIIDGGKQAITFNNDTEPLAIYVDGELQQNVSFVPQLAPGTGVVNYTSEYKKNLLNLQVSGNTTQKTYAGYNLLNKEDFNQEGLRNETAVSLMVSGVLSNEVVNSIFKPNTTYTVSFEVEGLTEVPNGVTITNVTGFILYSPTLSAFWFDIATVIKKGEIKQFSKTFTTSENFYEGNYTMRGYSGRFELDGVGTIVECIFRNVQIVEGSTQKPYEPYVGGIPSPNPDYPQPIENANSNGMNVVLHGDNLFNQEDLLTDSNFTKAEYNGVECIKLKPSKVNHIFPCFIPKGKYTLTFDYLGVYGAQMTILFTYEDGTTQWYRDLNNSTPMTEFLSTTRTLTATQNIVSIDFRCFQISNLREYYLKNIMLNIGDPKPYEPYFREEIAIPASVEVTNDGTTTTVQLPFSIYDKLTVNRVSNEVIYHQGAGYRELRGTETFGTFTTNGEITRFTIAPSRLGFKRLSGDGYCSHFIVGETVYFGNDPIDNVFPKSITFVYDANSVEAFERWLAAQYAAGTPVTILAEYTEVNPIDITNTTLGQSLLNLATQNQTNYIEVTGNANAPETPIKLTYAKWGELVENNGNA